MRRLIIGLSAGLLLASGCGGCDEGTGGPNNGTENNSNGVTNGASNGASNGMTNGGPNGATNGETNGQPFDPDETREEYCAGEGPPVIVGNQGGDLEAVCTGDLAAVTFRYALCVCSDLATSGPLFTDSFDSDQGPYNPDQAGPGGAVGVNGKLSSSELIDVGGTCWVGGEEGISLSGNMDVAFDLHDAGRLQGSKPVSVGRNAWVAGDVGVSDLTVGGTLHMPQGATFDSDNPVDVVREPVDVPLPCDCDDLVDIGSFVEINEQFNHNDDVGLDPDVLSSYNDDTTLDLDCGRYYLSEIDGSDNVTINISGRTAIFIGGDIRTSGTIRFNLEEGAEVDLFVGGIISMSRPLLLGDERFPSKARLYLAGENYSFSESGVVAGNIYAPNAKISASGELEVYGSVFAGEISFSEALRIHYDEAILDAGESCEGSGGGQNNMTGTNGGTGGDQCSSCKDCNNQACNDGVCGECEVASDCCSPLICVEGECVPYIL